MSWLREYSPEMFNFKYLNERLFIYQFLYNLGNAFEYDKENWIEDELNKFACYFSFKEKQHKRKVFL